MIRPAHTKPAGLPLLLALGSLALGMLAPLPALAGVGQASSDVAFLDNVLPDLAAEPLPADLLLQAGQQFQFRWSWSETNPGAQPEDYLARVMIHETVVSEISWQDQAGTPYISWLWDIPEVQSAQCRLVVSVSDTMGNTAVATSEAFTVLYSTSDVPPAGPVATSLAAPYPNPFNPTCRVAFSLAETGHASVNVHDVRGHRVATLHEGTLARGDHVLQWDGLDGQGRALPGGSYFFVLDTRENGAPRRLVQRAVLLP